MKDLKEIVQEKLKISSKSKINTYKYVPKDRAELFKIINDKTNHIKNNEILDLNDIDVSNITDLSYLFCDDNNLKITAVDMNSWDVSNVKDIHGLFFDNDTIKEIHIENWDVSNVETAYGAFYFCFNVKELNLDKWNLKKCNEFTKMFKGCDKLDTKFTDKWADKIPDNLEISNIDEMFSWCKYVPEWYNKLINKLT